MSIGNIKKKSFHGVKCGWCVRLTTLLPSMSPLSRQCGILNISQPYRPPRPVKGITLLFLFMGCKAVESAEYQPIFGGTYIFNLQVEKLAGRN
jgi:hypothetical protein